LDLDSRNGLVTVSFVPDDACGYATNMALPNQLQCARALHFGKGFNVKVPGLFRNFTKTQHITVMSNPTWQMLPLSRRESPPVGFYITWYQLL
jgi:hypothetical protein